MAVIVVGIQNARDPLLGGASWSVLWGYILHSWLPSKVVADQ